MSEIKMIKTILKKNLFFFYLLYIIVIVNYYSKKISLRYKILLKGRKYLIRCLKGKLNRIFYRKYNNPRVTVIIPVYNCQNTIVQVIRSIQNQKMTSIEILLVNDKSNNETVNIIQNIQKSDKRIKLINNKKNMGTLYSRNIGVLQAKGKYIFQLDNDDMFLDDDIINIIYEEAYNFNYDIVGFQAIKAYNYKAKINQMENDIFIYKKNFTIKKPKLRLFGISKRGKLSIFDVRIWSKCIKNSIYKNAVNLLGKKRYSYFMSWNEDASMVFVLFSVAKSYRYITRYGIFRLKRDNSASKVMPYSHKLFAEIFFLNVIYDFTKNNFKSKKFAFFMAIKIRNDEYFQSLNKINKRYLKHTLKKLLSCPYINNEDKIKLKINYKEFI